MMNRDEDRSMVNNLEEQQRLMMLRSQGMPPPPASNNHVNHMNNLEEEQQRLMMLQYHRRFQAMPRLQHTDPSSSSSNPNKAPVYPPGSRFLPTNLGCVRVHLRNKVDKKKSGFIRTLDLYKDDPWLLKHVQNDLFPRGEWYYFTPRNRRGVSSCNRTVTGSKGGGTWKSTSKKEPIMDKDNKVQGYMQNLVYNKINSNGDIKPTGWNMTEYCLHKENQDYLVLCHLKGNLKKNEFAEEVNKKSILPNQVQEEEEAGANRVEMKMPQEDHGDPTQHQQQQEQDALALALPPHEGQGHGDVTQQQQQPQEQYTPVLYRDSRFETMRNMQNNITRTMPLQEQQEQYAPVLALPSPHVGQDLGFETTMTTQNNNDFMPTMQQEDYGDATQKQQEQYAPVLYGDSRFETMLQQEDHGDTTQQQQEQDAPVLYGDSRFETMRNMQNYITRTMPLQEDHGDATQQQQEEDAPVPPLPYPHVGQDLGFETTMTTQNNNDNNFTPTMQQEDHGDPTPQQQQEQDAPVLPFPSYYEDQDPWFDTITAMMEADLKYHWDDQNVCFRVDDLLMEDDVNEGYLQQPVSQAPDALGGSDAPGGSAD